MILLFFEYNINQKKKLNLNGFNYYWQNLKKDKKIFSECNFKGGELSNFGKKLKKYKKNFRNFPRNLFLKT